MGRTYDFLRSLSLHEALALHFTGVQKCQQSYKSGIWSLFYQYYAEPQNRYNSFMAYIWLNNKTCGSGVKHVQLEFTVNIQLKIAVEIKNLQHALRVYPTIHHYLNIYDSPTFVVYMLINYIQEFPLGHFLLCTTAMSSQAVDTFSPNILI